VGVTVPAGAGQDALGNGTTAVSGVVVYDPVVPTVIITPNATRSALVSQTFTAIFSEPVTGLVRDDVLVTNGSVTAFAGSGTTYQITARADADGDLRITLPAGAAQDAGNNATPQASAVVTIDRVAPVLTVTPATLTLTSRTSVRFTITASETVTGLDVGDLLVTNGDLDSFAAISGGWEAYATPRDEGNMILAVVAGACSDTTGNPSGQATATVAFDAPSSPVLVLREGTTTYQRGDPSVALDTAMDLTDPDLPANFDAGVLTVSITDQIETIDRLAVVPQTIGSIAVSLRGQTIQTTISGVTLSVATWVGGSNGSNLVITWNREATPANVRAVLRSLGFSTPASVGAPTGITKRIHITATDGTGTPASAKDMGIQIVTQNTPPTAGNVTVSTLEDTAVNGTLASAWSDPDSPASAITLEPVGTPVNGSITAWNSATGAFEFTPAPNAVGAATFQYRVRDESSESSLATVTINVTPVNDQPSYVATALVTIDEDAGAISVPAFARSITTGPTDEASQSVTFEVTVLSGGSLFSIAPAVSPTGSLTFTTAPNTNGVAQIRTVMVDSGGTGSGGVDRSTSFDSTITINSVNDPPAPFPLDINAVMDVPWHGQLRVVDPDGDPVTGSYLYAITGISRLGVLTINATSGAVTFTPTAVGSETVAATVTDQFGATIATQINIWVNSFDAQDGTKIPRIISHPTSEVVANGDTWEYVMHIDPTSVGTGGILEVGVYGLSATITRVDGATFRITTPALLNADGATRRIIVYVADTVNHRADAQTLLIVVTPAVTGGG